jgi:hypothetical protein
MKISKQALIDNQEKLYEKFGFHEVIVYYGVSQSQLSIARYSGAATVNGKLFVYIPPPHDMLVRDDVVKFLSKLDKPIPKLHKKGRAAKQEKLGL